MTGRWALWLLVPALCAPRTAGECAMAEFADGVPREAERIVAELYGRAADAITEAVLRPTGRTFDARAFRRGRAAKLIRRIDAALAAARGRAADLLGAQVAQAVSKGLASALDQLRQAGVSDDALPVTGGFTVADRRTVAVIAADMAVDLDAALSDHARRARRWLRATAQTIAPDSEVSRVVAQGAITGDVRAAVRQMRGLLNAEQIDDYRRAGQQVITVGKAQMTVRAYARMLVRTRTREATVQARSERLVANGFDLVTIVGRLSENFCTAYLGRVFSVTGRDRRYPALGSLPGGGPPFHPNCSKSTAAYVEDLADEPSRRRADLADERFVTSDAAEAQRLFDAKNELANARRRLA